jgi:hypothetical protein
MCVLCVCLVLWGYVSLTVPFAYIYIVLVLLRELCMSFPQSVYEPIQYYLPWLGHFITMFVQQSRGGGYLFRHMALSSSSSASSSLTTSDVNNDRAMMEIDVHYHHTKNNTIRIIIAVIIETWCVLEALFYITLQLRIRWLQNKDPLESSLSAAPLMELHDRQQLWRYMMDSFEVSTSSAAASASSLSLPIITKDHHSNNDNHRYHHEQDSESDIRDYMDNDINSFGSNNDGVVHGHYSDYDLQKFMGHDRPTDQEYSVTNVEVIHDLTNDNANHDRECLIETFLRGWFFGEPPVESISRYDIRDFLAWSMFENRNLEHLTSTEWEQLEDFVTELEYRISLHRYGVSSSSVNESEDNVNLAGMMASPSTSSLSDFHANYPATTPPRDYAPNHPTRKRRYSFSGGMGGSHHVYHSGLWRYKLPVPAKCTCCRCVCWFMHAAFSTLTFPFFVTTSKKSISL